MVRDILNMNFRQPDGFYSLILRIKAILYNQGRLKQLKILDEQKFPIQVFNIFPKLKYLIYIFSNFL